MSLGLVVVTYRSSDVLAGFLDSLTQSSLVPDDIVVVDNSPTKVSLPKKGSLQAVSVIHRPDNPGYGTAANVGVAALSDSCDWVVVCNPDILVDKDTLQLLLDEAESHDSAGSLGPAIRNDDGSLYPSARALPSLGIGIGHGLLGVVWPGNPWTRAYRGDYESSSTRETGWLSGSFLLLRREAWEAVGGFDEKYFMFFEDVDLGWRLQQHGYRNLYVPSATAIHEGGHSTKSNYTLMLTAHHESAVRFIAKRYPGPLFAPVRAIIGLGLTLREKILRGRALQLSRN
jgi:N-acetylglucosaminyl-diphospho-decaprenol L-rhamnosyltransferase